MTDISNPMAHQLPLLNHRSGLVQPSLVMNHHMDLDCHSTDIRISKFATNQFILFMKSHLFSVFEQRQRKKKFIHSSVHRKTRFQLE